MEHRPTPTTTTIVLLLVAAIGVVVEVSAEEGAGRGGLVGGRPSDPGGVRAKGGGHMEVGHVTGTTTTTTTTTTNGHIPHIGLASNQLSGGLLIKTGVDRRRSPFWGHQDTTTIPYQHRWGTPILEEVKRC